MEFDKILEEAQKMQAKIQKAQEEIANSEFVGEASNGLVKVTISGNLKVKEVKIDPTTVNKDDVEMLEELLMIAVNDALNKVEEKSQKSLAPMSELDKIDWL